MKKVDMKQSVFYERYKPSCVEDLVLPEVIKVKLQKYADTQEIPNIGLFSSEPGTGKSSTANAIISEIGGEALWINASMEKGIDVLRGKVAKFASQNSFDDNIKIVVMDEFDHFSKDGQAAFRGFIDEFSENCRFIFTGNYKEKIIQPLLDRLEVYDYNSFSKKDMVKPIFERLEFVLKNENIEYNPKDLVPVINTYYPRIRSMVGALQKFTEDGKFVLNINELDDVNIFDKVMQSVRMNTFNDMVIEVNKLNAPDNMYSFLYNNAGKYFKPEAYPQVVITIAKYQEMSTSVRDKNLNLAACLTELMKLRA
ncbi:putative sliding clamp loader [Vibrio phage phiKT1024]|nr:putative sliding clamp loader [Vibrio phage phiKT1024]